MLRPFFLFFLFLAPGLRLHPQPPTPPSFDLEALLDAVRRKDGAEEVGRLLSDMLPGLMRQEHREAFGSLLSQLYQQPRTVPEDYLPLFSCIEAGAQKDITPLQFRHLLETYQAVITHHSLHESRAFVSSVNTFFTENSLHSSGFHQWACEGGTYDFAFSAGESGGEAQGGGAPTGGPMLVLRDVSLHFASRGAGVSLPEISGAYHMIKGLLYGEQCLLPWPVPLAYTWRPMVKLEKYALNTFRNTLESFDAALTMQGVVRGEMAGYFSLRVDVREGLVPFFASYRNDINPIMGYEKASYVGGVSIERDIWQGRSHHGDPGTLTLLGKRGHKLVATGTLFNFLPERITGENVMATIHHTGGYIDRGHLALQYQVPSRKLLLMRDKDHYPDMPFYASFFDTYFSADLITWGIEEDDIHISLLTGRAASSVHFQSGNYFSAEEFRHLKGAYAFHPLVTLAHYAKKTGKKQFTVAQLSARYKIEPRQVAGAMEYLHEHRFIRYNAKTETIEALNKKLWHYLLANRKKKDYDSIIIQSYTDAPYNASLNTLTNTIKVRGVDRVRLGEGENDVYVEPRQQELLLRENRDFSFSGKVVTRTLSYEGEDFSFDYEAFELDLKKIDNLAIGRSKITHEGSVVEGEAIGSFTETAGILKINDSGNRSGKFGTKKYPSYSSEMPASLYFDKPEILKGVYDRRFRFVSPPFDIDSINSQDFSDVGFLGTFHGGDIFPPFDEEVRVMPDKVMGIAHEIPEAGYLLYDRNTSRAFGSLTLDRGGIQVKGSLTHYTTTLYGDRFIFYPEKVTGFAKIGIIQSARYEEDTYYPSGTAHDVSLLWFPAKDDMLLITKDLPILLYDQRGTLNGTLNVRRNGLFAYGDFVMDDAQCRSKFLSFHQERYTARRADFMVLTEQADKPALRAADVRVSYYMEDEKGYINPEEAGESSLEFPYAQMKTSVGQAIWENKNRKVVMEKPTEAATEDTHFYSTKAEMKGLSFNGDRATYDMDTYELRIHGVPYIEVADVHIVPKNGEVSVLEDSYVVPFEDATLYMDGLSRDHTLVQANLTILSRYAFQGDALYEYKVGGETFHINFDQFSFQEITPEETETDEYFIEEGEIALVTVSNAYISEALGFKPNQGFYFKGDVELRSDASHLVFRGHVKPAYKTRVSEDWIAYRHDPEKEGIVIDFDNARLQSTQEASPLEATPETTFGEASTDLAAEDFFDQSTEKKKEERRLTAGIFYSAPAMELYTTFLEDKLGAEDTDVFTPAGWLSYDEEKDVFLIEEGGDSEDALGGRRFVFSEDGHTVDFEGPIWMGSPSDHHSLASSCIGRVDLNHNAYSMEGLLLYRAKMGSKAMLRVSDSIAEKVEQASPDVAYSFADENFSFLLANLIGEESVRRYEQEGFTENLPLHQFSSDLSKGMLLSGLHLKWDPTYAVWHNAGRLGLVNLYTREVNASIDGYVEVSFPSEERSSGLRLLFLFSEEDWYYFSHAEGANKFLSGDYAVNKAVHKKGGKFVLSGREEVEAFTSDIASTYAPDFSMVLQFPQEVQVAADGGEEVWDAEEDAVGADTMEEGEGDEGEVQADAFYEAPSADEVTEEVSPEEKKREKKKKKRKRRKEKSEEDSWGSGALYDEEPLDEEVPDEPMPEASEEEAEAETEEGTEGW